MKKKIRATAPGAAKRRKSGVRARRASPRRQRAGVGLSAAGRCPMTPSRPFAGSGPNWRGRSSGSRNCRRHADTDFLLDIPNRRGFERELHRSIAYIKRYHASGALIVLDVDRLKPINDAFGHAAGDQVLKAIVGHAVASGALLRRDRAARRRRVCAVVVEPERDRRQGESGGAGTSHRPARASRFAAAPSRRAPPPALPFSARMRKQAGRWKKPTARCMCARRKAA